MDPLLVNKIRNRCWHSISPDAARAAGEGMTVADIKQFIAFRFLSTPSQLQRLACYLGVPL